MINAIYGLKKFELYLILWLVLSSIPWNKWINDLILLFVDLILRNSLWHYFQDFIIFIIASFIWLGRLDFYVWKDRELFFLLLKSPETSHNVMYQEPVTISRQHLLMNVLLVQRRKSWPKKEVCVSLIFGFSYLRRFSNTYRFYIETRSFTEIDIKAMCYTDMLNWDRDHESTWKVWSHLV